MTGRVTIPSLLIGLAGSTSRRLHGPPSGHTAGRVVEKIEGSDHVLVAV